MIDEELYRKYFNHLIKGDRAFCTQLVQNLLNQGVRMKPLYMDLFQRSLYDVGALWETNKITVAIEHLCTSITESMINMAYPYLFNAEHIGKKAVVLCTPGEYHQVGARMVADYFELNGWDGLFLGRETPIADLKIFIEENSPDVLAISMSLYFSLNLLLETISEVNTLFPELPIIVGGQGFCWGGNHSVEQLEYVQLARTLDELDEILFLSDNE